MPMASPHQPDLFSAALGTGSTLEQAGPELSVGLLQSWQGRVADHQAALRAAARHGAEGGQLFLLGDSQRNAPLASSCDPLALTPQNLNFWRWPSAPQQGAALYFVVDHPPHLAEPLLLYVGETGRADRRWKGAHDCKSYLAAYGEALARVGLPSRLTIRFWSDVPTAARARRALEQALIQHWQPPFNKETRERWATPFTADTD
jgi:hypothetical protein